MNSFKGWMYFKIQAVKSGQKETTGHKLNFHHRFVEPYRPMTMRVFITPF
jgi:hypothetical protein